jgi:hypothetical protein
MSGSEPAYQKLASLWKRSWERNGWTAAVIGEQMARKHPFSRLIYEKTRRFPSHNGRNYEAGCWVRWAAAAASATLIDAPVVMADTDVINYGLTPEQLSQHKLGDFHVLDRFGVPCMVYMTPRGAEWFVEQIVAVQFPADRNHYSDMLFMIEEFIGKKHEKVQHGPWLCYAYGDNNFPDWQKAPCVHFSAGACRGQGDVKLNTVRSHIQNGVQAS